MPPATVHPAVIPGNEAAPRQTPQPGQNSQPMTPAQRQAYMRQQAMQAQQAGRAAQGLPPGGLTTAQIQAQHAQQQREIQMKRQQQKVRVLQGPRSLHASSDFCVPGLVWFMVTRMRARCGPVRAICVPARFCCPLSW